MMNEKTRSFGFTGQCLKLIKNYLTDRKQTIRIGQAVSEPLPVHSCVPQGSILGPWMFILYLNGPSICAMSATFGYADDYKILNIDHPFILNIDAKRIWNWCVKKSMAVKVSKTKILSVKGSEETAEMKDLGLIITSTLSWTENAANRSTKALKALCSVKRNISKITSKAMKLKSHKSYVSNIVSYGSSLWKPSKRDLKIIESVQKKETAWILSPTQEYKDRSISLHNPLLLQKILTGKTDLQWRKFIS